MGVGGHFWDLLKPYARHEGPDFLLNKRVAVDLSYWIVQHETAIKAYVRNPHLRLTFFRTINLFSKFGALPVFVVDGTPSPLKSQARIVRFYQASGIDLSNLPMAEEGASVARNPVFTNCVKECVELLELLGMPVLKAQGEAEALCAQLNSEGHVDACVTADSDALIFGASCVIKNIEPNSKEPFECYYMSDVESNLGLRRKHLIAISLLVGNDHDLGGVLGVGLDTAIRFVRSFSEDDVLTRLSEVGRGDTLLFPGSMKSLVDSSPSLGESPKRRSPHCSLCGHPGSKRDHQKLACEYCFPNANDGCLKKPDGFKCSCTSCDMGRTEKEQKKSENWQIRVCQKIAAEQNFPNLEIIEMYLNHQSVFSDACPRLAWENPKIETLVDYLVYHQNWEPSYIRQRALPMLSTIFLRETASGASRGLLCGQYQFDSIHRVKIRYGHQFYVVKWKKASPATEVPIYIISGDESDGGVLESGGEVKKSIDLSYEDEMPQVFIDDGCWFLTTDENMELVAAAFPERVEQYLKEKEMKSSRKKSNKTPKKSEESSTTKSVQLSITEFYRSSKLKCKEAKTEDDVEESSEKVKRTASSERLPKSVRRRLLFD